MSLTPGTRVYSEDQAAILREQGIELLTSWKYDSETYWDDAFGRVYGTGPNDGQVGAQTAPRTVWLPSPPVSGQYGVDDGLRITQTIKMPSQTHMFGLGGLMTRINCGDMTDTSDDLDRDAIHFGYDNTTNHSSQIRGIRINSPPRDGISTYKSGFGENTFFDDVTVNFAGRAGVYIAGNDVGRAFKPLRLGALNFSANLYGLFIDGTGQFRSQAIVDLVSGDNNLEDLIRVQGNPGAKTTTLTIRHIKCEISDNTANENCVNLRSGTGGICRIGTIYQDCIATPPHATATYRCINATQDTGQWKVDVDQWTRTDNATAWDDELAFDDGTLQLTWNDVNRTSLHSTLQYQYNTPWNTGGVGGVDERVATTTANLAQDTHTVNTFNKFVGKRVFNTTTSMPVYASGSGATDVWVDATGATAHTPV